MVNHPNRYRRADKADLDKADKIFQEATKLQPLTPQEPSVDRSFAGIRNALFDEWDKMRNGTTTSDKARAAARMGDVILHSVETQLETLRFIKTNSETQQLLLK
jgi:hypothetical protein